MKSLNRDERIKKRKLLLAKAQELELRAYQNSPLTYDYNSKEDYYKIIDSKKF